MLIKDNNIVKLQIKLNTTNEELDQIIGDKKQLELNSIILNQKYFEVQEVIFFIKLLKNIVSEIVK